MSFETSRLSVDTLLDLILMKLPEEARSARYCLDSEFQKLDTKTSHVLAQVRFARNTLSPVHALPPETLAIIFQYVLDGCFGPNDAPREDFYKWTAVTRVCRYWRESALSFATLWSTVSMGNLPAALVGIERSRSALLDIYVPSHRPLNGVWDKIQGHMPRVRKLAAKVYHLDTLNTLGPPIFAPNLQTLDIHKIGTQNRPLPLFFNGDTPKLSSVRLSGISNWMPNHFTGLKRLSIEDVHQELPIDNLLDILEANPTLEYLNLWKAEPTTEHTSRHITLPHLRQLKFSSGSPRRLMGSLSLPSTCQLELTSMVLDSLDRSIFQHAFPSDSIPLPNINGVAKLKINIGDRIDGIEAWGMTTSSAVFRLHVSSMARTLIQSTLGSFGPLSAASIRELCLQGCRTLEYPDPEAWKPLLESMTSLDTLWLVESDCEPVLRVLETDPGSLPCMRSLRVCSDRPPSVQAVRAMAQARRDQGCQIEHLLVGCRPEDAESWSDLEGLIGVVDVVVRPGDFPTMTFMTV